MAKMTIKKWNTSLNSGNGDWEEHYPKTTQNMIYDSTSTTTSIFDDNKKLKVAYLPDAVFDSLYFHSTFNASSNNATIATTLQGAVEHAINNRQGVVISSGDATNKTLPSAPLGLEGYYFVISTSGEIDEITSGTTPSYVTASSANDANTFNAYSFRWTFNHKDSQASNHASSSGTLEVGDWIVIETVTGTGTTSDPITVTFSPVSNTYEIMTGVTRSGAGTEGDPYVYTAGAKGLVPNPGTSDYDKFLKGDGTWAVPTDTDTFRTIAVDTNGDGSANETLGATETLMLKKGSSITLAEAAGVVTIGVSTSDIESIVGAMVTSNSESGISVTFDDNGNLPSKLDFSVPEMGAAGVGTGGSAGLVPSPGAGDNVRFLRGDKTFATPLRRIVKINGTEEISNTSSTAADFINGVGVNVSATSGSGTLAGEVQFSMQYPIAVNDTEANVSSYEVDGGIWFDTAQS
jgi:hypothetical protein